MVHSLTFLLFLAGITLCAVRAIGVLSVVRTDPPPGTRVAVPSSGCAKEGLQCEVEGGRVGWEFALEKDFNSSHQMRPTSNGVHSKDIFSLNITGNFAGSNSQLMVCGTGLVVAEVYVGCFAYDGLDKVPEILEKYITVTTHSEFCKPLLL